MSFQQRDFSVRLADWKQDRQALCDIRRKVFIEEQHVPEALEWDGLDADCVHVLASDKHGNAIGTARMTPYGHIGRMSVLRQWRNQGVGSAMLNKLLEHSRLHGPQRLWLNAQTRVTGFYQRFGFSVEGEEFLDAGIPHLKMQLSLAAGTRPDKDEL